MKYLIPLMLLFSACGSSQDAPGEPTPVVSSTPPASIEDSVVEPPRACLDVSSCSVKNKKNSVIYTCNFNTHLKVVNDTLSD